MHTTYFAPAERLTEAELRIELEHLAQNPLMDGLLSSASGLLAVLNEQRQIVALNDALLKFLGIENAGEVLGLRPGEAIGCDKTSDAPSGCGTGEACKTCGAAIAIVAALSDNIAVERTCAINVKREGHAADIYLRVQCSPLVVNERRFILLFLHDITREQQAASVERAFFHDVVNHITALVQASEALARRPDRNTAERAQNIFTMSLRLAREVQAQRCLSHPEAFTYQRVLEDVTLTQVMKELRETFAEHRAADRRRLTLPANISDVTLNTDLTLLLRALSNLVLNALEATPPEGEVRLWIERPDNAICFCVWNQQSIPPALARRIFQRNFSTKPQPGRGLGTYAAKLFATRFLGGSLDFSTSDSEGTTFRLSVPYSARNLNPLSGDAPASKQPGRL